MTNDVIWFSRTGLVWLWKFCSSILYGLCVGIWIVYYSPKKICSRKAIDANEGNKFHDSLDGISNTDNNTSWREGDAIATWATGLLAMTWLLNITFCQTSCFSQDAQVYYKNSANNIFVNQYIFQFHRGE